MALINFEIRHDGTNISDHVINYSRFQYICTGIGTIDIQLENINLGRTISPWDTMVLYEDGTKIGTYIVASAIRSAEGGTLTLQCQDYSKKLVDHFVTDQNIVTYATTTRYWIELFLTDADLTYEFTTDSTGEIVGPNASYGMSSAYDLVISLLQQSGWYIYFDQNGKAIVGELNRAGDAYDSVINDDDIISLERARNDQRLRNRAVVWGAGDPITGTWIGADVSVNTPWNYDSDDKRAVVLANGMIYSTTVAEDLARKMLNEFSQIANEITVEIVNHYGIDIGDLVYVRSKYFSGRMMVTTIESTGSKDGLVVKLTLNQKCPRLFAYFGILGQYIPVYIGTWGQGVWKKYTGGSIWSDSSSGLIADALYIIDLFIKNGVLACVTNDGYLYRADITTNIWTKFEHGDLLDLDGNVYPQINEANPELTTKAVACSIDDLGNIVVGYNYNDEIIKRSWVLTVSGTGVLIKAEQVLLSTEQDIQLVDLESVGYPEEGNILSVYGGVPGAYFSTSKRTTQFWGGYNPPTPHYSAPDKDTRVYGPPIGDSILGDYLSVGSSRRLSQVIVDEQGRLNFLTVNSTMSIGYIGEVDITNWTTKTYQFTPPSEWGSTFAEQKAVHLHRIGNTFNIGMIMLGRADQNISYDIYTFNTSGSTLIPKGSQLFTSDGGQTIIPIGHACKGSRFAFAYKWVLSGSAGTKARFVYGDLQSGEISFDDFFVSTERFFYTPHDYYEQLGTVDCPIDFIVNGDSIIFAIYYVHTYNIFYDTNLIFGDRFRCNKIDAKVQYALVTDSGGHIVRNSNDDATVIYRWDYDTVPYTLSAGVSDERWAWAGGGYRFVNTYMKKSYLASLSHIDGYPAHDPLWNRSYEMGITWSSAGPTLGTSQFLQTTSYTGEQYDPTGVFFNDHKGINRWGWSSTNQDAWWNNVSNSNNSPIYAVVKSTTVGGGAADLKFVNLMGLSSTGTTWPGIDWNVQGHPAAQADNLDNTMYFAGTSNGSRAILGMNSGGLVTKRITGIPFGVVGYNIIGSYLVAYTAGGVRVYTIITGDVISPVILKHTSAPITASGVTASGIVASGAAEQTGGIFEVILLPPTPTKVEISKGVPTVVYASPSLSGLQIGTPTNYLAASVTNLANDFYFPPENTYNFYDARVFDLSTTSGAFTIASGILPDSLLERYIALATSGEITLIKYDLTEPFYSLVTMSGLLALASGAGANPSGAITLFETTNYTLDPYLFVGISGPPPMFFQRGNPYFPYWVNYSYTLPSSDMTIIRVDDFI